VIVTRARRSRFRHDAERRSCDIDGKVLYPSHGALDFSRKALDVVGGVTE
jgi:hypothetical protein